MIDTGGEQNRLKPFADTDVVTVRVAWMRQALAEIEAGKRAIAVLATARSHTSMVRESAG